MAASLDGGKTFGDPATQLAVGANGTVYALYPGGTLGGFATAAPTPLLLGRSTDQSKTWEVLEATPPGIYPEGVQVLRWSPEGGAEGTLHAIYEDKPDQPPAGPTATTTTCGSPTGPDLEQADQAERRGRPRRAVPAGHAQPRRRPRRSGHRRVVGLPRR